MKDMHSHLLYGIDDGSKTMEESLSLLKKMEASGVTELILTPHYVENSKYNCNNLDKEKIFQKLEKKAMEEHIHIKLYLGNEVFISNNMIDLLYKGEVQTLNHSKYLLFEFPMSYVNSNAIDILRELVKGGYVPILAHPERYLFIQKNPKELEKLLQTGILMQGNFTSLFRKYGRTSKKTLKFFLKKKWIAFLGSDTHHEVHYNREKLEKKLLRITRDKEYVRQLLETNFDRVINNEDIGMIR